MLIVSSNNALSSIMGALATTVASENEDSDNCDIYLPPQEILVVAVIIVAAQVMRGNSSTGLITIDASEIELYWFGCGYTMEVEEPAVIEPVVVGAAVVKSVVMEPTLGTSGSSVMALSQRSTSGQRVVSYWHSGVLLRPRVQYTGGGRWQ